MGVLLEKIGSEFYATRQKDFKYQKFSFLLNNKEKH